MGEQKEQITKILTNQDNVEKETKLWSQVLVGEGGADGNNKPPLERIVERVLKTRKIEENDQDLRDKSLILYKVDEKENTLEDETFVHNFF